MRRRREPPALLTVALAGRRGVTQPASEGAGSGDGDDNRGNGDDDADDDDEDTESECVGGRQQDDRIGDSSSRGMRTTNAEGDSDWGRRTDGGDWSKAAR